MTGVRAEGRKSRRVGGSARSGAAAGVAASSTEEELSLATSQPDDQVGQTEPPGEDKSTARPSCALVQQLRRRAGRARRVCRTTQASAASGPDSSPGAASEQLNVA